MSQWLTQWLSLFSSSHHTPSGQNKRTTSLGDRPQDLPPLTDGDYEFLLSQLLERVIRGSHYTEIESFFQKLEYRMTLEHWCQWLERYGEKLLAAKTPNQQLAARLMVLGEASQPSRYLRSLSQTASQVGQRVLTGDRQGEVIWEYGGPDTMVPLDQPLTPMETIPPQSTTEAFTPEQLVQRLQEDPLLAQQLAQELGLGDQAEPKQILLALMEQAGQAIENPQSVEDWFNLGLTKADQGDFEGAIAAWETALSINPNLTQAWHNCGSALGHLGRFAEAVAKFDQALQFEPHNFFAWKDRGNAYYHLQNWEEAIGSWQQALELDAQSAEVWFNLGCAYEQASQWSDSCRAYEQALMIQPEFPQAEERRQKVQAHLDSASSPTTKED